MDRSIYGPQPAELSVTPASEIPAERGPEAGAVLDITQPRRSIPVRAIPGSRSSAIQIRSQITAEPMALSGSRFRRIQASSKLSRDDQLDYAGLIPSSPQ